MHRAILAAVAAQFSIVACAFAMDGDELRRRREAGEGYVQIDTAYPVKNEITQSQQQSNEYSEKLAAVKRAEILRALEEERRRYLKDEIGCTRGSRCDVNASTHSVEEAKVRVRKAEEERQRAIAAEQAERRLHEEHDVTASQKSVRPGQAF